uniref:Uncharacterized protein n=1 Tax=Octopus bimaculoides TaxID=37653 RepID=A0A0L8FMP6_OCTBM
MTHNFFCFCYYLYLDSTSCARLYESRLLNIALKLYVCIYINTVEATLHIVTVLFDPKRN